MTQSPPPNPVDPDDRGDRQPSASDGDRLRVAQLDAALAAAAPPAGLVQAVLGATRDHLPAAGHGEEPLQTNLDRALAPHEPPAELADAVLAATAGELPGVAAGDPLPKDRLDAALAPAAPPAGLADAVLSATRDHLPAAAPIGRIGWSQVGWTRAAAVAALVAVAAAVGWLGLAGSGSGPSSPVAADRLPAGGGASPVQIAAGEDAGLDADAERLLETVEALDNRLARADSTATDPVELLGQRLAAVVDAGPWSDAGLEGIDRAIEWEVSFEAADDPAWVF